MATGLVRLFQVVVSLVTYILLGQLGELASAVPDGGIVGCLPYSFHVMLHVFLGVVGVILNVL